MVTIPILVQDFALRNLTNAVVIDTGKFTIDQFNLFFTASNPAPAKLAQQLVSCTSAYDRMNAAYAVQMKSLDTEVISSLDSEGDQLVYAVTGTVEAFMRMAFDAEKQRKAQVFNEFWRKYKIDAKENMISQWSKIQQACEEEAGSAELQAAAEALGLTGAMARLSTIATELRQKITERSAEAPEAQAMKNAREAFYPEYRALILLLNSFAAVDDDPTRFSQLITTLNKNINYVRIHAMAGGSAAGTSNPGGGDGSSTGSDIGSGSGSGSDSGSGSGSDSGSGSGTGTGTDTPGGGGSSSGGDNGGGSGGSGSDPDKASED